MWRYVQRTGALYRDGEFVAHGYSGFGLGKNNPLLEASQGVGPIPCGIWRVEGPPMDTESHGPFVLRLVPVEADLHGRHSFLIHGDSRTNPGGASRGCIILGNGVRRKVWDSGDHDLEVVSGDVEEAFV